MTLINESAPGLLDQQPRCLGTYGASFGRPLTCSPSHGCGLRGCPWQRTGRRTPEAQADIAAARAAPTGDGWAGELAEQLDARTNGPPLDAALSNAALADTPAVREMGGAVLMHPNDVMKMLRADLGEILSMDPGAPLVDLIHGVRIAVTERREAREHGERLRQELSQMRQPDTVVLIGTHAAQYRALADAARKAQESAATARADGAALLQLFQAFCAGIAPGKEG